MQRRKIPNKLVSTKKTVGRRELNAFVWADDRIIIPL